MGGRLPTARWPRLPSSSRRRRARRTSKRFSSAPPADRRRICIEANVISALLYLQYHSIRNRTVMRIKRLKQPKYLVGGIVGGLYFYWYFFRTFFGTPTRGQAVTLLASPENLALFESIGRLFLLTILLLAWIIPHQRAALDLYRGRGRVSFSRAHQPPGLDPFQAAALADRDPVHHLAADAGDQPVRRQRVDSRGGLVADLLHLEPAFPGFLLCADDAAGPRHHQLAAAAGHPGPGPPCGRGSDRLGPANHARLRSLPVQEPGRH